MALGVSDLQDLIGLLRQHPEWREAIQRELFSEDLLEIPRIVREAQAHADARFAELAAAQAHTDAKLAELTEVVSRLGQEVSRLGQEVSRLGQEVSRLGQEVSRLGGRVGNIEGTLYEQRYREHIGSRLGRRLRRATPVSLGHLDPVLDAVERGELSEREWEDLTALDLLVKGRRGAGPDTPEQFVAMEISITLDRSDVVRAHERAGYLARVGLPVEPCVGGRSITEEGRAIAASLGVTVLLDRAGD